jgi:hypothetical protein
MARLRDGLLGRSYAAMADRYDVRLEEKACFYTVTDGREPSGSSSHRRDAAGR